MISLFKKDFCRLEELSENVSYRARWINKTEIGETLSNVDDFFARVRFCDISYNFSVIQ